MNQTTMQQTQEFLSNLSRKCFEINTLTPYAAFYSYSGHVNAIDIRVARSKEDYNVTIYERMYISLRKGFIPDVHQEIIEKLDSILQNNVPVVYIVKVELEESSFKKEFAIKEEAKQFCKKMKEKYQGMNEGVNMYAEKVGVWCFWVLYAKDAEAYGSLTQFLIIVFAVVVVL